MTIKEFTLELKGFPNEALQVGELNNYIENIVNKYELKDITNISLAYQFNNSLGNLIKVSECRLKAHSYKERAQEYSLNDKEKKRYIKKMEKYKDIASKEHIKAKRKLGLSKKEKIDYRTMNNNKILKAFVSFEDSDTAQIMNKMINKVLKKNSVWRFCFRRHIPQEFLFRKKFTIRSKKPDNPSNINWQNLEKSKSSICGKICISFIVIVLVLIVFMLINMLVQSLNTNYHLKQTESKYKCDKNISNDVFKTFYEQNKSIIEKDDSDLTETEKKHLIDIGFYSKTECYCGQFGIIDIIKDTLTKYKYCKPIIDTYIKTFLVSVITGIVISFMNFILVFIISRLVLWIPFKSLTTQVAIQIIYIFIALFINTFIILFVLYSEVFVQLVKRFDKKNWFSSIIYKDLNKKWFADVGFKIFVTMLVSIINPSLIYLFKNIFFRISKNTKAGGAKTMKQYIIYKTPLVFDIERRFALLLNIVFVCIILCSGIPLLMIILGFILFILFWIEKYIYISYTKKPPIYTSAISSVITKLMPLSSLIMIGFTIYIFGSQELFPIKTDSKQSIDEILNSISSVSDSEFLSDLIQRMKKCWQLSVLFVINLIYFLFQSFIFKLLKPCIFRNKNRKENLNYFNQKSVWKYNDLADYDFRRNKKFSILKKAWSIAHEKPPSLASLENNA